jgi:hypothetical protein
MLLSVLLTEQVFDPNGAILWEEDCPFETLPTPGFLIMRKHVLYEVVSSRLDGVTVKTVAKRHTP